MVSWEMSKFTRPSQWKFVCRLWILNCYHRKIYDHTSKIWSKKNKPSALRKCPCTCVRVWVSYNKSYFYPCPRPPQILLYVIYKENVPCHFLNLRFIIDFYHERNEIRNPCNVVLHNDTACTVPTRLPTTRLRLIFFYCSVLVLIFFM